jgi:hypothetical protein
MCQPNLGFGAKLEWDFSHGAFPDRTTDSESVALSQLAASHLILDGKRETTTISSLPCCMQSDQRAD